MRGMGGGISGFMGMANQNMSTPVNKATFAGFVTAFNPPDTSWTCPRTGYYIFTARGGGGYQPGGSGGATQRTVLLHRGEVVNFTVGYGAGIAAATSTVVTFPDGVVMTAGLGGNGNFGGGTPGAGGVATGGDINIPGNPSVGGTGGDAPAIGDFPSVAAASAGVRTVPGAGAGAGFSGTGGPIGGGQGILYLVAGKAPRIL